MPGFSTMMSDIRAEQAARAAFLAQPLWLPQMEAPNLVLQIISKRPAGLRGKIATLEVEYAEGRGCILTDKQQDALIAVCHAEGRGDFLERFFPVPYAVYLPWLK